MRSASESGHQWTETVERDVQEHIQQYRSWVRFKFPGKWWRFTPNSLWSLAPIACLYIAYNVPVIPLSAFIGRLLISEASVLLSAAVFCWSWYRQGIIARYVWYTAVFVMTTPISIFFLAAAFVHLVRYYARVLHMKLRGEDTNFTPLSGNDAYWSLRGHQNVLSHILICMMVDGEPDVQTLRDYTTNQLMKARSSSGGLLFPFLQSYVETVCDRFVWKPASEFNIEDHIRGYERQVNSPSELSDLLSDLYNTPFPPKKPHWDLLAVPLHESALDGTEWGLKPPSTSERSCVVFRIHHSCVDGVSLVQFFAAMMSTAGTSNRNVSDLLLSQPLRKPLPLWQKLFLLPDFAIRMVYNSWVYTLHREPNPLHGPKLSGKVFLTWTRPFSLNRIKAIKNRAGVSVNDVILAGVTGALRRACIRRLQDRGEPAVVQELSVAIPVSLHEPFKKDNDVWKMIKTLGNEFSCLMCPVPTNVSDAGQRLQTVSRSANRVIGSFEALRNYYIIHSLANTAPLLISNLLADHCHCTAAFSNLRGPTFHKRGFGHEIDDLYFFIPNRGNLGLSYTLYSYEDTVRIALSMDEILFSDKQEVKQLVDDVLVEFEDIERSLCIRIHHGS